MIAHLRGKVEQIVDGAVVLDVGGIGFYVRATAGVLANSEPGQERHIATEFIVRQDEMSLYGFSNGFEREMFRLLTSISGLGPKLSLRVLSSVGPAELAEAISDEDITFLTKIPGVGAKTAKRIVVELSEKINKLAKDIATPNSKTSQFKEAEEVLCSLGCSPEEAKAALEQCILSSGEGDQWTSQRLVVEAMRHMGGV